MPDQKRRRDDDPEASDFRERRNAKFSLDKRIMMVVAGFALPFVLTIVGWLLVQDRLSMGHVGQDHELRLRSIEIKASIFEANVTQLKTDVQDIKIDTKEQNKTMAEQNRKLERILLKLPGGGR